MVPAGADPGQQNGPPEAAEAPAVPGDAANAAAPGPAAGPAVAPVGGAAAAAAAVPPLPPLAQQAPATPVVSAPSDAAFSAGRTDGTSNGLMNRLLTASQGKVTPSASSKAPTLGLPTRFGAPQTAEQRARTVDLELPAFFVVVGEPEVAVLQDPVLGAEEVRRIEAVRSNLLRGFLLSFVFG